MDILQDKGAFRVYDADRTIIFTDEQQLDRVIRDPELPLYQDEQRGFSGEQHGLYEDSTSLMTLIREAADNHCVRVETSYDFFFGGSKRQNYPMSETTLQCFKVIHDVAKEHGLGFGASLVNPLDIGHEGHTKTGSTCQFQEAKICPDGSYHCLMRCQKQWNNNKGPISLELSEVRCYAFHEEPVEKTPYLYVDPDAILDISSTASVEVREDTRKVSPIGYASCDMEIRGVWKQTSCNRVLCVAVYKTAELDYFAPEAFDYFKNLLDLHNRRGITYQSFHSDEMHIQFDWDMSAHFGEDEICVRYLTPSLMDEYARRYGEQYRDFTKYLVYFTYGRHAFSHGMPNAQHVFGRSPEDVYQTWLFRSRYYELLQSQVVNLCLRAKKYAESLWGGPITTRAHSTWQESPTCDRYLCAAGNEIMDAVPGFEDVTPDSPPERRAAFERAKAEHARTLGFSRYDYTPWYDWSSSIRENMAACYDYFKWKDFFTGGNCDFPEIGNLDRTYYGQAMGASLSALNPSQLGYLCGWGMPKRVSRYVQDVCNVYGAIFSYGYSYNFVQGLCTRETDVLALYPLALNSVEERFGSWMVQYGYCNYISEEQFLRHASLTGDGRIQILDREYRALTVLFQPILDARTAELLSRFVRQGGKLLWMSIYPVVTPEGASITDAFCELFGIETLESAAKPLYAKDATIQFTGSFAGMREMRVPTDFLVDAIYPVTPSADTETVAVLDGKTVACRRRYPNGGEAVYAGFRVRDDQSCSLGEDVDTLFQMLTRIGAYRDNSLEVRSRRTGARYLMTSFPNGAIAVTPHYREVYEAWPNSFFRDEEYDALLLQGRELPDRHVRLEETVRGQQIRYEGTGSFAYRYADGRLFGLVGEQTTGITVNGRTFTLSDRPADLNFALVQSGLYTDAICELYMVCCQTAGAVLSLPVGGTDCPRVELCGENIYRTTETVPCCFADGTVHLTVSPELVGKFIAIFRCI